MIAYLAPIALGWIVVAIVILGLCCSAAAGDRAMDERVQDRKAHDLPLH